MSVVVSMTISVTVSITNGLLKVSITVGGTFWATVC